MSEPTPENLRAEIATLKESIQVMSDPTAEKLRSEITILQASIQNMSDEFAKLEQKSQLLTRKSCILQLPLQGYPGAYMWRCQRDERLKKLKELILDYRLHRYTVEVQLQRVVDLVGARGQVKPEEDGRVMRELEWEWGRNKAERRAAGKALIPEGSGRKERVFEASFRFQNRKG
jgi:hypothetical protein